MKLAASLGWRILPSGAIYRAVAVNMLRSQLDEDDEASIAALVAQTQVSFCVEEPGVKNAAQTQLITYLNGECIDQELCKSEVTRLASHIAQYSMLRQELLPVQRSFAKEPGLVAEGRDMGTVVFPDAQLKLYLDASAAERAKRRWLQLRDSASTDAHAYTSEEEVLAAIESRDHRDATRENAPLKQHPDAIVINTDNLSVDEVVDAVLSDMMAKTPLFNK